MYSEMTMEQLVAAHNLMVAEAQGLGAMDYQPVRRFETRQTGAHRCEGMRVALERMTKKMAKTKSTPAAPPTGAVHSPNSRVSAAMKELGFKKSGATATHTTYKHDEKGTVVTGANATWKFTKPDKIVIEGKGGNDLAAAVKTGKAPVKEAAPA